MKLGASAHKEKTTEMEEALLRFLDMYHVSKTIDKEDARQCAIKSIDREIETLKNIKGLEFALMVSRLKKVKKQLLTINI